MPMLSFNLINGTLLQDPGEGMLVPDFGTYGAGISGDTRILEDDVTDRVLEDDIDTRILESDS